MPARPGRPPGTGDEAEDDGHPRGQEEEQRPVGQAEEEDGFDQAHHVILTILPSLTSTEAYQRCGSGKCGPSTAPRPSGTWGPNGPGWKTATSSPRASASRSAFFVR